MARSTEDAAVCCARCGKSFSVATGSGTDRQSAPVPSSGPGDGESSDLPDFSEFPEFSELEDWDFEETLGRADRLVRSVHSESDQLALFGRGQRSDAAHVPEHHDALVASDVVADAELRSKSQPASSIPWLVLALGLAVFVCGAALIGMSLASHNGRLWDVGLPMVLGGQMAVLAAVIWQQEAVWQGNRATFLALHTMDEQVRQLRSESPTTKISVHDAEDPLRAIRSTHGGGQLRPDEWQRRGDPAW